MLETNLDTSGLPKVPPRFKDLKPLGEGGMAVVYQAYDQAGEREVALKFLPPTENLQLKKRFQREAVDLAGVFHPNIVEFYSLGEIDGQEFIEMELVEGGSLSNFLRKSDSLKETLEAFAKICDGLAHIHEKGLVHRDIKPANILVTEEGEPKISDLGLARQQEGRTQLTQDGTVLGTAAYLAPEQLRSHAVNHCADLYALGVCLFEAVTCRKPFEAETTLAMLRAHFEDIPPTPSDLISGLPEKLDSIVLGLLEKSPEDRPQSASSLATDLRELVKEITPEQDGLVSTTPQSLMLRAEQHIRMRDFTAAELILDDLEQKSEDQAVLLASQVKRVRISILKGEAKSLELAENLTESRREADDIKELGQALVLQGQAALLLQNWDLALKSLEEARGLVSSTNRPLQVELMESLASLHEEGSSLGLPEFRQEKAKQFRQIAQGLATRSLQDEKPNTPAPSKQAPEKKKTPVKNDDSVPAAGPPKMVMAGAFLLLLLVGFGIYKFATRPAAVEIVSDPPGATVTVNGDRFTSPYSGKLAAGEHKVKVFMQGYFAKEEVIELSAGQKFKLTATLKPSSGNLNLISKPEGAKVYINGQAKGKTPVVLKGLPIQKFKLKLEKDGYKELEKSVEVFGGKTRNLEFALTQAPVYQPSYPTYSRPRSYSNPAPRTSTTRAAPAPQPAPRPRRPAIRVPQPQVRVSIPKPRIKFKL